MTLVLSRELARRIEHSEVEALESRFTSIQRISGNPMDIGIQKFGSATAFTAKNIPGPSFNTVKGLCDEDIEHVDRILEFYHQRDIPIRFEITPAHSSPELFAYLAKKGLFQSDFHTALYISDDRIYEKFQPLISIRTLEKNEFDIFADIYTKGFEMPAFLKEAVSQNNEILHSKDSWTFYLANYKDKPAGIGVLFVYDGIGTLAASTTVPDCRNKGIQKALIIKRLEQARRLNAHMVVGQARYGSVSQNNMEKLGMKVAYTKAIWIKR